jgi:hypothetical protein
LTLAHVPRRWYGSSSARSLLVVTMASQKRKRARKKKRQLRSVFVLARPLTIADKLRISFVSDGILPLCHWAMLVSKTKEPDISDKIQTVKRNGKSGQLGTLFELVRHKNDNHAHMNQLFGPIELNTDWRLLSIAYVGVTDLSDEVLEDHGKTTGKSTNVVAHNITRLHPKYNGLKNNCQNFIHYLLAYACPGQYFPRTIQNVVDKALTIFNLLNEDGQDGRETHRRVDQVILLSVFFL